MPEFPAEAKEAGILEGVVTLRILINTEGIVEEVRIIDGPDVFRTSAIRAAKSYRFRPGKDQTKKVWMILPIHFKY